MFRSSTIIRELALNLAKVIFMLKHSAKLLRYFTECFNIRGVVNKFPDLIFRARAECSYHTSR